MDMLVSSEWLAGELGKPDLVVLDCTIYLPNEAGNARDQFLASHIPGARMFDIDRIADAETDLPHMVPTPARFAKLIGALGVSNTSRVVFYDQLGLRASARGWWMLRLFGHENAAVLDGGLPKWQREGRPVEAGAAPEVTPAEFVPDLIARRLAGIGDVKRIVRQGGGEALGANSIKLRKVPRALRFGLALGFGGRASNRGDHDVLRGVLGGDEFEDLGLKPRPFEELRTQGVGDELGLPLLKDSMAQRIRQDRRRGELAPKFLLATGRDDEKLGAGADAVREGIVGGRITGVQRDENIALFERRVGNMARDKGETRGEIIFARDPVAQVDQLRSCFDTTDLGSFAEQGRDGEGQIALAAAHIHDRERAVVRKLGLGEEMRQELGELLNLAEFVRHSFSRLPAFVGHAERAQPRGLGGNQMRLGTIMSGGGKSRGEVRICRRCCRFDPQSGGAVGLSFELGGLAGAKEMRIQKLGTKEGGDLAERIVRGEIPGDVARGMPPDEGEVRARLEGDGPNEDVAYRGVGPAVSSERELHQRTIRKRSVDKFEETIAGGRLGHGAGGRRKARKETEGKRAPRGRALVQRIKTGEQTGMSVSHSEGQAAHSCRCAQGLGRNSVVIVLAGVSLPFASIPSSSSWAIWRA